MSIFKIEKIGLALDVFAAVFLVSVGVMMAGATAFVGA
jgi:hypothetical protein